MTLDALEAYGLEQMSPSAISGFLASQRWGVLGLPSDGAPYLFPISFGFDGESSLYFTYLLGGESRKRRLTDRAETAGFLAYSVDTAFQWESVYLTGTLAEVPAEEWDGLRDVLDSAWRPQVFETATVDVAVYRYAIQERTGIRHSGLPPGLRERVGDA